MTAMVLVDHAFMAIDGQYIPPPLESLVMCVYGYETIASNTVKNNDTVDFCVPKEMHPFRLNGSYVFHSLLRIFGITWNRCFICVYTYSILCCAKRKTYLPQTFDIRRTLVGNNIVDHSDVIGATPVDRFDGSLFPDKTHPSTMNQKKHVLSVIE